MADAHFKMVVLHSFRHKESGVIVKGYSDIGGMGAFYLKSGAGSRKHNLSILHPLAVIQVMPSTHRFGEMGGIKEFESLLKLSSIRGNVSKMAIALFLSEIITKTIREIEPNPGMFRFVEQSIQELERCTEGVANFHLFFLVKYIGMLGYLPDIPEETKGMLFDINSAGYTAGNTGNRFGKEESRLLWSLYRIPPANLGSLRISGEQRTKFLAEVLRYLSYHTGHDIHIDSLGVLHEVFSK